MTARKSLPLKPSAGTQLIDELSRPTDPFSMTFLIEQAGHTADHLERLNDLLAGERSSWTEVKLGAKTVEVVVTNLLVQHRQASEQLRKLLLTIDARRGSSGGPSVYNPTNV